jgi:hypothetical protein
MNIKLVFWKYFGIVSTVLLDAAALDPDIFKIPLTLRPWVFLVSVIWFFLFCTGQFGR